MTSKQYSKPQLIAIGDVIEMTLHPYIRGRRRDNPHRIRYWFGPGQ